MERADAALLFSGPPAEGGLTAQPRKKKSGYAGFQRQRRPCVSLWDLPKWIVSPPKLPWEAL
eukprot:scaffold84489_cov31-Tisochrysis_lutea.AAC.1